MNEARFLKDVESHVLEIIRDDEVHRHVRFRKPGTMCMHFDLITWPGYLCYTGDMGTYVFSRLQDMFQFFRTDRKYADQRGRRLAINLSYWSEKLEAVDSHSRGGSATEFSAAKFRRVIEEWRVRWIKESCGLLTKEQRRSLWEAVRDDVLDRIDDGEHEAYTAARDFRWGISGDRWAGGRLWEFEDLWDHDFTEYTFRFQWCCYALAWGIETYDTAKASTAEEVTA
jgi:hypothetical protein